MTKYLFILLSSLVILLAGCALSQGGAADVQLRIPPCYPIYYPYEDRLERIGDVRPVPDYGGWTDARIARDTAAIAECGCSGVAVALTPQQLASEDVQERLAHFAEAACKAGLKTTVLLCAGSGATAQPMRIDAGNLASFLRQALAGRMAGALADSAGNPVWCYDQSSIVMEGADVGTLDVVFLAVAGLRGEPSGSLCGSSLPVVHVADCGECRETARREQVWSWRQPRLDGEKMEEHLKAMASAGKPAVLLQSWNCYSDGSFAEQNSLDGDAILLSLKRVLLREKQKK